MTLIYRKSRIAMAALIAASGILTSLEAQAQSANQSFDVVGGTTAHGTQTDVPGSGGAANISNWNPHTYTTNSSLGFFELEETSSGTPVWLGINVTGVTGSLLHPNTVSGIGIFQTSNSQGLQDDGTFSVYVRPLNAAGIKQDGAWSIDLTFTFYSDAGMTMERASELLLTTLDLDYGQVYYTQNSDFQGGAYQGANVTSSNDGTWTRYTAAGDATFSDPNHAVASLMVGGATSFTIRLEHNSEALFMFELRNPPDSVEIPVPVPEPGLMALVGIGGAAMLVRRFRRK